jgi:hypothetical protein
VVQEALAAERSVVAAHVDLVWTGRII